MPMLFRYFALAALADAVVLPDDTAFDEDSISLLQVKMRKETGMKEADEPAMEAEVAVIDEEVKEILNEVRRLNRDRGMGGVDVVIDPVIEEEAAAVGDPHLKLTNSKTADLCCKGGVCTPCHKSLLQAGEAGLKETDEPAMEAEVAVIDDEVKEILNEVRQLARNLPNGPADNDNAGAPQDQAEAVGDPHMTLTNGKKVDLCCKGGLCTPCPKSLLQAGEAKETDEPAMEAEVAVIDDEVKEILNEVRQLARNLNNGPADNDNAGAPQDEAEAVGDPHMTLTNGKKVDLCCKGGLCTPCRKSLLQAGDASVKETDEPAMEAEVAVIDDEVKEILNEVRQLARNLPNNPSENDNNDNSGAPQDEAEAVGDPHMTLANGKKVDLCCKGGVCTPCIGH